MAIRITIDEGSVQRERLRLERRLTHPRPVLKRFRVYMLGRTGQTFRRLRRGGSFRGVRWPFFAPQYTRRSDGVTVPAWGGVPRLRGRGRVKGRKRPSGQRLTRSSSLLRDTGRLAAAAGATARFSRGGRRLEMITRNVEYGPRQQTLRPFLFFEVPRDAQVAAELAQEYLERE